MRHLDLSKILQSQIHHLVKMYLSLLDGKYGGRIYALMFSFSAVGMDFMAQDLGRQGLSTAQVVFMRMVSLYPLLMLEVFSIHS